MTAPRAWASQARANRRDPKPAPVIGCSAPWAGFCEHKGTIAEGSRAADRLCKILDIRVEACGARMPGVSSSVMTRRTACGHDDLSAGRSTRMIVRIYTGHDGQSHFEDLPLPAEESHNVALQAGANLVFRCFPADHWSDWHTAPRRQYIFILVGQMEIGIGDGTTRRFGPGDVVLADDLTGQGHTTRSLGVPRISATVPVGA